MKDNKKNFFITEEKSYSVIEEKKENKLNTIIAAVSFAVMIATLWVIIWSN